MVFEKDEKVGFFSGLAGCWDEISKHDREKIRYIVNILELNGNESILDVGTGTGVMIPFYHERLTTGSVHAMDFSKEMIAHAMENCKVSGLKCTFDVADICEMDCRDMFDVVVCYSCFPHFYDKERAIHNMWRSLRQGGMLMIAHSSSRNHINHVHGTASSTVNHDMLPCICSLERMLSSDGFKMIHRQDDDEFYIIAGRKQ